MYNILSENLNFLVFFLQPLSCNEHDHVLQYDLRLYKNILSFSGSLTDCTKNHMIIVTNSLI